MTKTKTRTTDRPMMLYVFGKEVTIGVWLEYAQYAENAEYIEYAEYAEYTIYAQYAQYAEYIPIVFLVERLKI